MSKQDYLDFFDELDFKHWSVEELKIIKNCILKTKSYEKYIRFLMEKSLNFIKPNLKRIK